MAVKSRTIILVVPCPVKDDKAIVYEFKLRGIGRIDFGFDISVGTAQGIASNFIHPWFIKPVAVSLSGSTYIGTFDNVKDIEINEVRGATGPKERSTFKSTFLKFFGKKSKGESEQETGLENFSYPRIKQLPHFIEQLYYISESIRKGTIRTLDKDITKQQLIITDYVHSYDKIVFDGFITKIRVEEEARKLGVLTYNIEFVGIPKLEKSRENKETKKLFIV
jgi:hypothetical protein